MILMILYFYNFLNKNYSNSDTKLSYSYLLLYFMNKFDPDKNLGEISPTILINYIFSIFTLSLIAVLSLFSAIYLLLSIYLINNYNIKEYLVNYPRILKSILFAEKINKI
jgi:hypothetical protein